MKKTANNRLLPALMIAAMLAAISGFIGLGVTSARADITYYICYESDDYRVRPAQNAMTGSGGKYTISPTLAQGEKFYVSDGNGVMYGNAKGEPVTIVESGTHRYTVTFDPSVPSVTYTEYSPETVTVEIAGASTVTENMTYRRANAAFEEYVYTAYTLKSGDTVTVIDGAGTRYDAEKFTVAKDGDYRFTFTKDEDNLYDGKNVKVYDVPELYVLCDANGFTRDPAYRMTRDEDVIAYEEYCFESLGVAEKNGDLKFSVLDADDGKEYKPTESGKLEDLDKGDYRIVYSPDHAYRTDGDATYRASAKRREEYYGGYYVLGDFNGYEYAAGDDFDRAYKLVKNSQADYDEYELTLFVTDKMLSDYDGAVEFYISDGTHIYRKPTGGDIKIDRAGEYDLYFSPEHNYGRGYFYRYERVGDEPTRETVYISTVDEYNGFAAKCVSPEFTQNKTVVLKNSLDFTGKKITPMAVFAGEFDGLYNTLSGIELSADDVSVYLIGKITDGGTVKRLDIQAKLSGGDRVAPIAECYGTLDEVNIKGEMKGDSYVGGLVGSLYSGGEVIDCASSATVNGLLNVGGLVGFNAGEVRGATNTGNVNNKAFPSGDARSMLNVGGICGYSTGNIFDCENQGNVGLDQSRYFGGIAGLSSGGIYFCENGGEVGAENYAGGIVGYYGRFSNDKDNPLSQYLAGTEFEKWLDEYFGTGDGNFEEAEDTLVREIYYCFNGGSVRAENYVGGVAGRADAESLRIVGCVSTGDVTAGTSYVGGIAGEIGAATVSECVARGRVTAQKGGYAGGAVGSSSGVIEYCASSSYVEAETNYIGGIAGSATTVGNCVSHAYVKKSDGEHFGAVAGSATAYKNNFYPSGIYSDKAYEVKGIDGINYGSENNYGACELDETDIVSQGMLSPELFGLDAEHWLAGETEARYPVPRCFTDVVMPDKYTESGRFERAFSVASGIKQAAEDVGKISVTVTFFEYDFDAEKYELCEIFYISSGSGLTPPDVPQEDGYFTWWDRKDFGSFTKNTDVRMLYDKYITSLASDDTSAPTVIATGKFYSDTKLELVRNGEYISLLFRRGDEAFDYGTVGVRYYVGKADNVSIQLIRGGEIVNADFTVDGGYAIFELGNGEEFCAKIEANNSLALIVSLSVVGTAIVVALCFTVPILVKRNKRKKSKQAESSEAEPAESKEQAENEKAEETDGETQTDGESADGEAQDKGE